MAIAANLFANVHNAAWSGNINWGADSIKMALLGSGYTPNLSTQVHWADISSNEISGTGYTAGGQALTSKTLTVTTANSWGTVWAATTAYTTGSIVIPPAGGNGFLYEAVVGGTSGGSAPTFPTTVDLDVTDSGVTWACIGESITQFSSASPSWPSSTLSANYAVIYDADIGAATPIQSLIAVASFGGAVTSSSSTLTVVVPTLGWFWLSPA